MNPLLIIAIIAMAAVGGSATGYITGYERGAHARDQHWQSSLDKKNDEIGTLNTELSDERAKKQAVRVEKVTEFVSKEIPVVKVLTKYVKTACDLPEDKRSKLNEIR